MRDIARPYHLSQAESDSFDAKSKCKYGISGQFLSSLSMLCNISIRSRHKDYAREIEVQIHHGRRTFEMKPHAKIGHPGTVSLDPGQSGVLGCI